MFNNQINPFLWDYLSSQPDSFLRPRRPVMTRSRAPWPQTTEQDLALLVAGPAADLMGNRNQIGPQPSRFPPATEQDLAGSIAGPIPFMGRDWVTDRFTNLWNRLPQAMAMKMAPGGPGAGPSGIVEQPYSRTPPPGNIVEPQPVQGQPFQIPPVPNNFSPDIGGGTPPNPFQIPPVPNKLWTGSEGQGPNDFRQYAESMMAGMPQAEKQWYESPLYPIATGLMGIGRYLMTPPALRGQQDPFKGLKEAMAAERYYQTQEDENRKALYKQILASYPYYLSATTKTIPKTTFAIKPSGEIMAFPGEVTQLKEYDKPIFGWFPGPGGAPQAIQLPYGEHMAIPGSSEKQNTLNIYDEATGELQTRPLPRGNATVKTIDPWSSLMSRSGAGGSGRKVYVRTRDNKVIIMDEEEAKRRGYQWPK